MSVFSKCYIDVFSQSNQYGDVVLKSLQNANIPDLDLFVREAVQNSSDASLGVERNTVGVEFNCRSFDCGELQKQLENIGPALKSRFPGSRATFIEVRDTNTVGLTGPTDYDQICNWENHGNYFKLVFDWGKKQEQTGAGGNWGFGKSVYYRVGESGLVFYYSRIDSDAPKGYEDRLIATMIEDCGSDSSILRKVAEKPTGRAWWGVPGDKSDKVLPVTDPEKIEEFLGIFELSLFGESERGTSVIIPYINESRLLDQVIPHDGVSEDELARCVWKDSVPEYLAHSIQKWYAPRIGNKNLKGVPGSSKSISAKVNGEGLRSRDMPRFFQLVQELYTKALHSCADIEDWESALFPAIKATPVGLRREGLEREHVGTAAFTKITSGELNRGQASLSPYTLTSNFRNDAEVNEPIVMFAREPGMVIDYSIKGEWAKGVPAPPKKEGSLDDEYIVAFFVPRTGNRFKGKLSAGKTAGLQEEYGTLGEYLRECEASDHASWQDRAPRTIVKKIQGHVSTGLAKEIKPVETRRQEVSVSRLASRAGKALLPPLDYASSRKPSGRGTGSGSGSAGLGGKRKLLATGTPSFVGRDISVPVSLYFENSGRTKIVIEALTEGGSETQDSWEKEISTPFPFEIVSASMILGKRDGTRVESRCDEESPEGGEYPLAVRLEDESAKDGRFAAVIVECGVTGQVVEGTVVLRSRDRTIECQLKGIREGA